MCDVFDSSVIVLVMLLVDRLLCILISVLIVWLNILLMMFGVGLLGLMLWYIDDMFGVMFCVSWILNL